MYCNNGTTQRPLPSRDDNVQANKELFENIHVAQLSIFSFVFVLGMWGNIMVIVTIFTQNRLRSSSNYFIANLAVADLGSLCLSIPMEILEVLLGWSLGDIACRLLTPLKDLFLHVSMITLTAIAIDRYVHVAHPFTTKLSIYKVKLIIALIWLVDYLLVPLPMAFVMRVDNSSGIDRCLPKWTPQHKRITVVSLSSVIFLFVFVTASAYLGVVIAMKQQRKRIVRRAQESGVQEKIFRKQLEKNAKTVKVMVVIVVAFWISVLPITFYGLLAELQRFQLTRTQGAITIFVTFTLLLLQNCVNPLILYALSKEMRCGFATCAQCCLSCQRQKLPQARSYAGNRLAKMYSASNGIRAGKMPEDEPSGNNNNNINDNNDKDNSTYDPRVQV